MRKCLKPVGRPGLTRFNGMIFFYLIFNSVFLEFSKSNVRTTRTCETRIKYSVLSFGCTRSCGIPSLDRNVIWVKIHLSMPKKCKSSVNLWWNSENSRHQYKHEDKHNMTHTQTSIYLYIASSVRFLSRSTVVIWGAILIAICVVEYQRSSQNMRYMLENYHSHTSSYFH